MWTTSQRYLEALRYSHGHTGYVEAWRGGVRLSYLDEQGEVQTRLPLDSGGSNEVQVDGSTPGVRRTLTATLAPMPGLWDLLSPIGTELRAFTVLRYLDGGEEEVPQGVFDVDVQKVGYTAAGSLSITAPDRWARVQRARFLAPRSVGGGTVQARALIASLILEALPAGSSVSDTASRTFSVPRQTEDRDREGLIQKIAKAAALDVYFDRNGSPIIRHAPEIDPDHHAWLVDASATGVFLSGDRERNRQRTYNVVVINGATNNGAVPFPAMVVWDANPLSPTFAGPGAGSGPLADLPAASTAGPFGQRPTFYTSPLLRTADQAVRAGLTMLERVSGLAAQLDLTASVNPALDDGDTILVQLPPERRDIPRPVERHIIDSLTVPLVPTRNAQTIATRSTRADELEDT